MKKSYCAILLLLSLVVIVSAGPQWAASEVPKNQFKSDDGFVVHEWGVTHVRANGMAMPEVKLPAFVYSAPKMENFPRHKKPILYFYCKGEKKVSVSIQLKAGRAMAWYPQFDLTAKKKNSKDKKMPVIVRQTLQWNNVTLNAKAGDNLPKVENKHWWADCRKVPSSYVHVGKESEKFIFYDADNIVVPQLKHEGTKEIKPPKHEINNKENYDVKDFFVMDLSGDNSYFSYTRIIKSGEQLVISSTSPAAKKTLLDDMKVKFKSALAKRGLYAGEIKSFMACWEKDIFEKKGCRVVYFMPEKEWEAKAPLTIEPKPDKIKRVMVFIIESN